MIRMTDADSVPAAGTLDGEGAKEPDVSIPLEADAAHQTVTLAAGHQEGIEVILHSGKGEARLPQECKNCGEIGRCRASDHVPSRIARKLTLRPIFSCYIGSMRRSP